MLVRCSSPHFRSLPFAHTSGLKVRYPVENSPEHGSALRIRGKPRRLFPSIAPTNSNSFQIFGNINGRRINMAHSRRAGAFSIRQYQLDDFLSLSLAHSVAPLIPACPLSRLGGSTHGLDG